jgi:predicted nucleic acid-binding protein
MASVVVDTDVISFAFKGDSRADPYERHLRGNLLFISFMTLAELDLWALEHKWGNARKARMEVFIGRFAIVPFDRALCSQWAIVTNMARRKGRPINPADAWIAATALAMNVPLVTNNPSDYGSVSRLRVISETPT